MDDGRHRKKKSLGQHFLRDVRVADGAVAAAALTAQDVVLEIGPGEGVLTRRLSARAKEVVAIELDAALVAGLERLALTNVRVVHADAVEHPFPRFDACVSNLPYQVSSPILFKLLDHDFRVAVLMVQKEFADRLIAKPGSADYGRLTVMAFTRARVERIARVGRGAFDPPPRVDSALVRIEPREAPAFDVADARLFGSVVRAAFTQRRKTLANALRNAAHIVSDDADAVRRVAARVPHAEDRPGAVPPQGFGEVASFLAAEGVTAPTARRVVLDDESAE